MINKTFTLDLSQNTRIAFAHEGSFGCISLTIFVRPLGVGDWQFQSGFVCTSLQAAALSRIILNLSGNNSALVNKYRWDDEFLESLQQ